MFNHDDLNLDTTIYKPWDFDDPWDSLVNFLLGGKSLLQQAQEGHGRALFFIWERWMKSVSKDTQQIWHKHQSKNPYHLLEILPFHPKTQCQNWHSHLLNLFDLDHVYLKPYDHKDTHGEP